MERKDSYSLIAKMEEKIKQHRFKCFIPGCNEYAIKSHSQSRANSLNNICENGHVVTPLFNSLTLVRSSAPTGCFGKIGIREASTFQGFCQQHDNEFFKQVDAIKLNTLNKESLSKLAFRTFAREIRTKERALLYCEELKSELINAGETSDLLAMGFLMGIGNFLKVTFPFYMKKLLSIFKNKNYNLLKHIMFTFNENIGLSCSSMIDLSPEIDEEKELGNLHIPRPVAFFNIIPQQSSTIVVFSYFPDEEQRVKNFIDKYELISHIIFNYCEEILFRPSLFNSFSHEMKHKIIMGLRSWASWEKVDFSDFFPNLILTSPQCI